MEAVIWSKSHCGYCESAKQLLETNNIKYVENKIGVTHSREDLLEAVPEAKTVPQIFIENKYIGGFSQLRNYLEDNQLEDL